MLALHTTPRESQAGSHLGSGPNPFMDYFHYMYMVKYEYFILLPHKVLVMLEMARSHMEWLLFRSIPRKLFLKHRRFAVLVKRNKRILCVLLLSTNIINSIQYKSSIFHYFSLFFKCCRQYYNIVDIYKYIWSLGKVIFITVFQTSFSHSIFCGLYLLL